MIEYLGIVSWITGAVTCAIFLALMTIAAETLVQKNGISQW